MRQNSHGQPSTNACWSNTSSFLLQSLLFLLVLRQFPTCRWFVWSCSSHLKWSGTLLLVTVSKFSIAWSVQNFPYLLRHFKYWSVFFNAVASNVHTSDTGSQSQFDHLTVLSHSCCLWHDKISWMFISSLIKHKKSKTARRSWWD